MTDRELLEAALARLAAVEARLAVIEASLAVPGLRLYGAERRDCGCQPNILCMNAACPRRWTVTCNTGGT